MDFVRNAAVAVRLSPRDNVATLITAAEAGDEIAIRGQGHDANRIGAAAAIAAGHKLALVAVKRGEAIVKYGATIGRAVSDIAPGEHVHVHNVESTMAPRRNNADAEPDRYSCIDHDQLHAFVMKCLTANGVAEHIGRDFADHLVEAHLRGVETHGLRRLPPYIDRIRVKAVAANAEPAIEGNGAVRRIDGRNGIGHHVGARAADVVAAAARRHGAAVGLVRNSNHFGFAGDYAVRIAGHGMIGLAMSNGQVLVGPGGALKPLFSNDPVAIAAPMPDGSFFEFDMALSMTSRAKIAIAAENGLPIETGIAVDADGSPTTDAKAALAGVLLPFGGERGFGLLAAVELLTGILPGGAYADLVSSKEARPDAPEGTSHFLLAIDIETVLGTDLFAERIADLARRVEELPMAAGKSAQRLPGARRWRLRAERRAEGIPLSQEDVRTLIGLAERFLDGRLPPIREVAR